MRPVARYQLTLSKELDVAAASIEVRSRVESWLQQKQNKIQAALNPEKIIADGEDVAVSSRTSQAGAVEVWGYVVREKSRVRQFETIIDVIQSPTDLHVDIVLRSEAVADVLAPQHIEVHRPNIVAELIASDSLQWQFGNSPLLKKPLEFSGGAEGKRLARIVAAQDRKTPLIVVSQDVHRISESNELAELIQRDLLGLTLVASCDSDAGFSLSSELGPGFGVYGGAVRLYWPDLAVRNQKWLHQLFVLPRGLAVSDDKWWDAANAVRGRLKRKLFSVSAHSPTIVLSAAEIYRRAAQLELDKTRADLLDANDFEALAESYSKENAELRKERGELREALEAEKAKVAGLTAAFKYREEQQPEEIEPESESTSEPGTISEAVDRARIEFEPFITLGDDVQESLKSLRSDAGPPQKVFDYLEAVALLAIERRKGPLGKSDIKWLTEQNFEASIESETVRNSSVEMARRRWSVGGELKQFELHLKPADGASPDRCVRIYFRWNGDTNKYEIGHVGRHPGT